MKKVKQVPEPRVGDTVRISTALGIKEGRIVGVVSTGTAKKAIGSLPKNLLDFDIDERFSCKSYIVLCEGRYRRDIRGNLRVIAYYPGNLFQTAKPMPEKVFAGRCEVDDVPKSSSNPLQDAVKKAEADALQHTISDLAKSVAQRADLGGFENVVITVIERKGVGKTTLINGVVYNTMTRIARFNDGMEVTTISILKKTEGSRVGAE